MVPACQVMFGNVYRKSKLGEVLLPTWEPLTSNCTRWTAAEAITYTVFLVRAGEVAEVGWGVVVPHPAGRLVAGVLAFDDGLAVAAVDRVVPVEHGAHIFGRVHGRAATEGRIVGDGRQPMARPPFGSQLLR